MGTKFERNENSHIHSHSMYNTSYVNSFAASISFPKIQVHLLAWLGPFESFNVSTNLTRSTDFPLPSCSEFCYWLLEKGTHMFINSRMNIFKAIPSHVHTVWHVQGKCEKTVSKHPYLPAHHHFKEAPCIL